MDVRPQPGRLAQWLRLGGAVFAGACCLWWLFADTVAHYQPRRFDQKTVRFAHFGSYQDFKLWERIIDTFEKVNPDIHVTQEYVPGWYGRYDTKIRQQILSGTLPHVVMMQMGPFANVAKHFAVLDDYLRSEPGKLDITAELDDSALSAFSVPTAASEPDRPRMGRLNPSRARQEADAVMNTVEKALPSGSRLGRLQGRRSVQLRGIAVAGGTLLIYCNPDCFAAAERLYGEKVPIPDDDWTIEEFASLAGRLTCDFDRDGRADQWGFWLPRWVYYLPFLWSFGAQVIDSSGPRWALTGPQAQAAFAFYRDLARDHRVCPKPAEVPQLIQDVGFLTGKVAMCVNGPWFEPFLARTRLRHTYRVVPIPRGPAGRVTRVTWDGLCIADNLTDREKRQAWRFVRFCVSPAAQRMIAETGRSIPARRDSMPWFDTSGADVRRVKFVRALSYARLQPRSRRFSEIDGAIGRHLSRFIADDSEQTPAEFLAALARDRAVVNAFGELPVDHSPAGNGRWADPAASHSQSGNRVSSPSFSDDKNGPPP